MTETHAADAGLRAKALKMVDEIADTDQRDILECIFASGCTFEIEHSAILGAGRHHGVLIYIAVISENKRQVIDNGIGFICLAA